MPIGLVVIPSFSHLSQSACRGSHHKCSLANPWLSDASLCLLTGLGPVIDNDELPSDDSQGDHLEETTHDYQPEDTDGDYYSDESWYPSSDEDGCNDYYRGSVNDGMMPGTGAEEELPIWTSHE